jgi:hypothetical protein
MAPHTWPCPARLLKNRGTNSNSIAHVNIPRQMSLICSEVITLQNCYWNDSFITKYRINYALHCTAQETEYNIHMLLRKVIYISIASTGTENYR